MGKQLIVRNEIMINAPATKVWEVLVKPPFIKQWDDLPEDFGEENLTNGSVIEWTGYSIQTVEVFQPNKLLRLSLYVPQWELPASAYNIAYTYTLSAQEERTVLTVEIGDFGQLADGDKYYQASLEFGHTALQKIKELAE